MRKIWAIMLGFLAISPFAFASHLRGGEITVRQQNCNQYVITLKLYTNSNSPITPGGGVLSLGDGNSITIPTLQNRIIDSNLGIGVAEYTVTRSFIAGVYRISYQEFNRNSTILNIANAPSVPFYVESELRVNSSIGCNNPIQFSISPIDRACKGIAFFHNVGAFDQDGDSLSFELLTPKQGQNQNITNYFRPNDVRFYTGLDYQRANENGNGTPVFTLNAETGDLLWDAPGIIGEYLIAIKVTEWRKLSGQWTAIGFVTRDTQVLVEDCRNKRPFLSGQTSICAFAGQTVKEVIRGFDPDFDPVVMEVFTNDNYHSSSPRVQFQKIIQSTMPPTDTANVKLEWTTTCDHVRSEPYRIVFKVTDLPGSGIRLSTFQTLLIHVVAPPPKIINTALDLKSKSLTIDWTQSDCAKEMVEVWRKIGDDTPIGTCERLSRAFGYVKIAEVSSRSSFSDQGLNPGARYCYRLVGKSGFGESSVPSPAFCLDPIVVDAPAVTKVSVAKSDKENGVIQLEWTRPFQIDQNQFPPPYEYEVYRSNGGSLFERITKERILDTAWLDAKINSNDLEFEYKIVVYAPLGITRNSPVDTSALASAPRLFAESRTNSVRLQWNAKVPWTNQLDRYPWHYIYRKEFRDEVFQLIDSVNVKENLPATGFNYIDVGKFRNAGLKENTLYVYQIATVGGYGNKRIREPLINFSNSVVTQPIDKIPPCKPVLSITPIDCEVFIEQAPCFVEEYRNQLLIEYGQACGSDVMNYSIYFTATPNGVFEEISKTNLDSWTHVRTDGFKGCYKIRATDFAGNISEESEIICVDNCPYLFLPNVITSNNDGFNEVFPALSNSEVLQSDQVKCSRFVSGFSYEIYNRWGKLVFCSESSSGLIEWKGDDLAGNALPNGVYFFSANVQFDVNDPGKGSQNVKGWLTLLR